MELSIFTTYLVKPIASVKVLFTKPSFIAISIPLLASATFTQPQQAGILLAILFIVDFATGILASWVEFKKALPLVPGSGKRYVIQSAKLRLSGVKFISYGLIALIAFAVEKVFVFKEIPTGHVTTQNMTLTTLAIAGCCAIEIYSIVFENIKRMGFDVIQKFKTMIKEVRSFVKTIKNDENEVN